MTRMPEEKIGPGPACRDALLFARGTAGLASGERKVAFHALTCRATDIFQ